MKPEQVRMWIFALGGRRCLMSVGSGIASIVLLVMHYISESTFSTIVLGTLGAYIVGNSWENHGQDPNARRDCDANPTA